ncbi:MAG: c-type cytochrome, partial [Chitinophagaceae bacterium]|nr:c-type cytochrome [Chitinophagaceae bacterium]
YRTRYRTKRELRSHTAAEVLPQLQKWIAGLDKTSPHYEHWLLEGLWVSWGLNQVDQNLLRQLLKANDYRVRAAAVEVLRFNTEKISDAVSLLTEAAKDESGRVRLEAIVSASWLPAEQGLMIEKEAAKKPLDDWMQPAWETAVAHLEGHAVVEKKEPPAEVIPAGINKEAFLAGKAIYSREGFCTTCHQPDGKGLDVSGFPPLSGSEWINGNEERLIKIVLKGLSGPTEVKGKKYAGQVPMTPFGGMLNDDEVAAVLTYVRNSFGNKADAVSSEKVKAVRSAIQDKKGFYTAEELMQQHPADK